MIVPFLVEKVRVPPSVAGSPDFLKNESKPSCYILYVCVFLCALKNLLDFTLH